MSSRLSVHPFLKTKVERNWERHQMMTCSFCTWVCACVYAHMQTHACTHRNQSWRELSDHNYKPNFSKSRKHTGGETAWEVSPEGPIFLFRRKIHDFDDCDLETFRSQRSHHLVSNFASALWFAGGSFHVQGGELFKQCSRFERLPGPMQTPSGLPRNHTLFPLDKR